MSDLLAVIDANNFYVSCERVFNPKLIGKPVIVLSNNDGCVVARSNEAKKLGIKMGEPFFKIEEFAQKNGIYFFSSNYKLYADLSARVMSTIMRFFPDVEIYSIDEAFVSFNFLRQEEVIPYAKKVRSIIQQWTGIPVSIGIAKTKTLAKLANDFAKKNPETEGVFNICRVINIDDFLEMFPIQDVWGVGSRLTSKFYRAGVKTAKDLKYCDPKIVDSIAHINGLRTQAELNEKKSYEIENITQPKKSITCSRSFGERVDDLETLETAISNYAEQAALKLRQQGSVCGAVIAFLQTSRFDENLYFNAGEKIFENYTNYAGHIISASKDILKKIYRPGFRYQKCGVILTNIAQENESQLSLFEDENIARKQKEIIQTYDKINARYGKNAIGFASSFDKKDKWKMIRKRISPDYTADWNQLLIIKI